MAENTKIQWTDHTVNFWTGCVKVSPGCKYCYMFRDQERYKKKPTDVLQVSEKTINKVLRAAQPGDKIFTCSWSDFFIEEADAWRPWAWEIIRSRPDLHWQILTKRPERIKQCLPVDWGEGWTNVWLGVSIESQAQIDRVDILTDVTFFSKCISFVSIEPMIGPIQFIFDEFGGKTNYFPGIDWVIVGGESGNDNGKYKYRPCHLGWISDIVSQCKNNDIPVFVKQMGTHIAKHQGMKDRHGGDINEFPPDLKIRQFPKI